MKRKETKNKEEKKGKVREMKVTVTGIMKGTSKNNRQFTQFFGTTPFTDYESESNDCTGFKTVEVFTYLDFSHVKVGDVCDFLYEPGYQGRATLSDVKVLKESGNAGGK